MTRRRWSIAASVVVAVVIVLFVVGTFAQQPRALFGDGGLFRPDGSSTSSPGAEPTPEPWTELNLPGYDADPGPLTLTPVAEATGTPISASFALEPGASPIGGTVGLSFDAVELASELWDSPQSNLTLMLSELDRPALRFGGNGVDRRMWWTSSDEPAPSWAEVTVTPADLERVAATAEDVDSLVTIDLDLGHDDPARAADMAAHAREAFGDRLLAVAIGNEPNGFFHENQPQLAVRDKSWGPEPYQESLTEYSSALEAASPGLPVSGPGAYDAKWWRAFTESGIPNQRALSMHWYPLWDCKGPASSIANPTVEDLTSPALREQAQHILGLGADVAAEGDLPLWMEETGPTSCPGTNDTSLTHAQALWTADYAMTAAELGVERLAFHSTLQACDGGAPMSPICARGTLADPGQIAKGRTSYLALMMMGYLPEGKILTPSTSGDGEVVVHGVIGDSGELALVLVDLRNPATVKDTVALKVSAPAGLPASAPSAWKLAEGSRLSGTALDAQESTMTPLSPVADPFAGAELAPSEPLTITSSPGSVTLLRLNPADVAS